MDKIKMNFEPPGGAYFETNLVEINNDDTLDIIWDNIKKELEYCSLKSQVKVQTAQGPSHQQDLVLRRRISEVLKKNISDNRKLAQFLSKRKTEILKMKICNEEALKLLENSISSF